MAARPIWSGFLKLSLVTVPVRAYTATDSSGEVHFNQLHADCGQRIKNVKKCPIHGDVTDDQIVSGYEYEKGQYVVIDPEELDKLRTPADKMVTIDAFVAPDGIDPVYLSGKVYYLVPEGAVGQHPFALIREGMLAENRYAVAKVVMFGREQVVLVRPEGGLLAMHVLDYAETVRPYTEFANMVPETDVDQAEVEEAKALIDAKTKPFDMTSYKDENTERLKQVIEAKVQGKEIVTPPPVPEQVQVINLMDALKRSVAELKGEPATSQPPAASEPAARPPKKVAASSQPEGKTRKRKTS